MSTRKAFLSFGAIAVAVGVTVVLAGAAPPPGGGKLSLEIAKIYWEYNASANDQST